MSAGPKDPATRGRVAPRQSRDDAVARARSSPSRAAFFGIGPPTRQTADHLWRVTLQTMCWVLVILALALAITAALGGAVSPLLTAFTVLLATITALVRGGRR